MMIQFIYVSLVSLNLVGLVSDTNEQAPKDEHQIVFQPRELHREQLSKLVPHILSWVKDIDAFYSGVLEHPPKQIIVLQSQKGDDSVPISISGVANPKSNLIITIPPVFWDLYSEAELLAILKGYVFHEYGHQYFWKNVIDKLFIENEKQSLQERSYVQITEKYGRFLSVFFNEVFADLFAVAFVNDPQLISRSFYGGYLESDRLLEDIWLPLKGRDFSDLWWPPHISEVERERYSKTWDWSPEKVGYHSASANLRKAIWARGLAYLSDEERAQLVSNYVVAVLSLVKLGQAQNPTTQEIKKMEEQCVSILFRIPKSDEH